MCTFIGTGCTELNNNIIMETKMPERMKKALESVKFTDEQMERMQGLQAEIAYEMVYNKLSFEQACHEWDV